MPRKRSSRTTAYPTPQHFFARQLEGEDPVPLDLAAALCKVAGAILEREPWRILEEIDLAFVDLPEEQTRHACSVMGALGQVFAVSVYLHDEGYQFFDRVHRPGVELTPAEFIGNQNSLMVDFVDAEELTKPDRELLKAVGHPFASAAASPVFRACRPGCYPWYPNADEAATLLSTLIPFEAFLSGLPDKEPLAQWSSPGTFPLIRPSSVAPGGYEFTSFKPPLSITEILPPAEFDEALLQAALARSDGSGAPFEVDHIWAASRIGSPSTRQFLPHIAATVCAETGLVLAVEVHKPVELTSDMLADSVIQAIRKKRKTPAAIHVRSAGLQRALAPLAAKLGVRVAVAELPLFDEMKASLLENIEGEPLD